MSDMKIKQERHNVRAERGVMKGKFVKKKVKLARENLAAVLKSKKCENKEPITNPNLEGRRIVELSTFAEELWCKDCNMALSLRNTAEEIKYGLSSVFKVRCTMCDKLIVVHTNKRKDSEHPFPVNYKAAMALVDGGIGEAQLNTILSSLNRPVLSSGLLKRYERAIGLSIEKVASESCRDGIRLEKQMTKAASTTESELGTGELCSVVDIVTKEPESNEQMSTSTINNNNEAIYNTTPTSPVHNLKASFDGGWQRRGTGHSYNSLSGHSSLIGYHSGKILSYSVRNKQCRMCQRGHPTEDHNCRKNFTGTAKAMEPDMAVELVNRNNMLKAENANISVLIGDDDSCTIAAVRREASESIEKWSDFNHAQKSLTNALYALKLKPKLIEYFSHCFSCAVKQNKGNSEQARSALQNIVPHSFGEHTHCGDWCGYLSLGENYRHENLPHGKPLADAELRVALTKLFTRFANNADKLAPCASSQGNESFNSIVASKTPKSKHYSSSESLNFRVAAAVCQKNIGCKYISEVYKLLELSPGTQTMKFREAKDLRRERKAKLSKAIEIKKRRLFHKKQRSTKTAAAQKREGITYQSECGLSNMSDLIKNSKPDSSGDYTNSEIVVFDLETSGLSKSAEICQIAACHGESVYNAYIIPSKGISPGAAAVTGLQVHEGEMFLHDYRLKTVPVRIAFAEFLKFLSDQGTSVILVAHNGFRFDVPRLLSLASNLGLMSELQSVVHGFADTLPIFRETLSERKKEKKKFTQEALAADFLPPQDLRDAHNAVNDVKTLQNLISKIGISDNDIKGHTKTVTGILQSRDLELSHTSNKASLESFKNISPGMKTKISKAGINKQILEEALRNGGEEGVRILLGEDVGGRPRVTKSKKIIDDVCKHLQQI